MRFYARFVLLITLLAGGLAGGCGSFSPDGGSATSLPPVAMAQFEFPEVYSALGSATFTGAPDGVKMMVEVTGIAAGSYLIRALDIEECPPYESSLPDDLGAEVIAAGRGVGTLKVDESGYGRIDIFVPEVTVDEGADSVVGCVLALLKLSESGEPGSCHARGAIRLMPTPEDTQS